MTPAPVVCNASPLIAFEQIGHLDVLEPIFSVLLVPPAVVLEVAPSVALPKWIEQRALTQSVGPVILRASLGLGESEAISLALETSARLVILNDRPARRLAQALRLNVIGTLGILLAAKRRGLLAAVRPCLEALLQHDFRMTKTLYKQVLSDADES